MHEESQSVSLSRSVLGALGVAMHHNREDASREMPRIVPARELELFRFLSVLAVGRGRVGIAAVGADQAVDHQLQREGAWYQLTGVTIMMPCAATHSG